MSREWKPGDVALYDHLRVMWVGDLDGTGRWIDSEGDTRNPINPTLGFHPLVVIDPEDAGDTDRLMTPRLRSAIEGILRMSMDDRARERICEAIQEALRSLVAPPKPEEPRGLGAVVEDVDGRIYTRYETVEAQPWWQSAHGPVADVVRRFGWEDIVVVRVLSEGWRGDDQ